ncbi:glutathione peroxidase [Flavobacterium sp. F-408]|uniref:Glutathione peroxidase n=2 Tax=Flavobacterium bernardetii TaxID=2813823 RepID=A0ABR7IY89_9FLAO|nr:glutathione peroxidase [Flavobacterium bernardetii]MBC5834756.1 glutathione peroxidase [Flavobacterium bernardetii]
MKLFHTFTGIVMVALACNTKNEDKKAENWEHFVENTNENPLSETSKINAMEQGSIYTFKVKDLSGNEFDFASLKGKKILIVNTASECGLTPQYEQLQAIYEKYQDKNFVIVGFPANNFGAQEPGTNAEIGAFCKKNYGVTFPMMEKISVKGSNLHEVYQFLTQKAKNGLEDSEVEWNFQKYLIDENGHLVDVISPRVLPNDSSITNWIEGK